MNTEHADPGERLSLGQRLAGALAIGLLAGAFFGAFGVAWAARPQLPPQHVTADAQSGPFSLASVSDAVAGHYQHAAANHDVYRQVTCYCGCESFADHAGGLLRRSRHIRLGPPRGGVRRLPRRGRRSASTPRPRP